MLRAIVWWFFGLFLLRSVSDAIAVRGSLESAPLSSHSTPRFASTHDELSALDTGSNTTCPTNVNGTLCFGNGECVGGKCFCTAGYLAPKCDTLSCPNSCSSHGTCNGLTGACSCEAGYTSKPDCSVYACPVSSVGSGSGIAVPCAGHGTCNVPNGTCACFKGWGGPACDKATCPGALTSENGTETACNGHGTCLITSTQAPQTAAAAPVFPTAGEGGEASALEAPPPPPTNAVSVSATCQCILPWSGADCGVRSCDSLCHMLQHGSCINGVCVCHAAWRGTNCESPACPGPLRRTRVYSVDNVTRTSSEYYMYGPPGTTAASAAPPSPSPKPPLSTEAQAAAFMDPTASFGGVAAGSGGGPIGTVAASLLELDAALISDSDAGVGILGRGDLEGAASDRGARRAHQFERQQQLNMPAVLLETGGGGSPRERQRLVESARRLTRRDAWKLAEDLISQASLRFPALAPSSSAYSIFLEEMDGDGEAAEGQGEERSSDGSVSTQKVNLHDAMRRILSQLADAGSLEEGAEREESALHQRQQQQQQQQSPFSTSSSSPLLGQSAGGKSAALLSNRFDAGNAAASRSSANALPSMRFSSAQGTSSSTSRGRGGHKGRLSASAVAALRLRALLDASFHATLDADPVDPEDSVIIFCSGRGTCETTGTCTCGQGWGGADCATPLCPATLLPVVVNVSAPSPSPSVSPLPMMLQAMFSGSSSSAATASNASDAGPAMILTECAGIGTCARNITVSVIDSTAMCICPPDRWGPDCSKLACPDGCTNAAQGICDGATGRCSCAPGFYGPSCAKQYCPGHSEGNGGCFGRGVCGAVTPGVCQCDDGYRGDACQFLVCLSPAAAVLRAAGVITGRSVLAIEAGNGTVAAQLLNGATLPPPPSSSNASTTSPPGSVALVGGDAANATNAGAGGGVPLPFSSSQVNENATSPTMPSSLFIFNPMHAATMDALRMPPALLYSPCGGPDHGVCYNSTCYCAPGWTGEACHVRTCKAGCNGRGVCLAGHCVCAAGWGPGGPGGDCSQRLVLHGHLVSLIGDKTMAAAAAASSSLLPAQALAAEAGFKASSWNTSYDDSAWNDTIVESNATAAVTAAAAAENATLTADTAPAPDNAMVSSYPTGSAAFRDVGTSSSSNAKASGEESLAGDLDSLSLYSLDVAGAAAVRGGSQAAVAAVETARSSSAQKQQHERQQHSEALTSALDNLMALSSPSSLDAAPAERSPLVSQRGGGQLYNAFSQASSSSSTPHAHDPIYSPLASSFLELAPKGSSPSHHRRASSVSSAAAAFDGSHADIVLLQLAEADGGSEMGEAATGDIPIGPPPPPTPITVPIYVPMIYIPGLSAATRVTSLRDVTAAGYGASNATSGDLVGSLEQLVVAPQLPPQLQARAALAAPTLRGGAQDPSAVDDPVTATLNLTVAWDGLDVVCDEGWVGPDCSIRVPSCHGVAGSTSAALTLALARVGASMNISIDGCGEHGSCTYGGCYCKPGYTGQACEVQVPALECPVGRHPAVYLSRKGLALGVNNATYNQTASNGMSLQALDILLKQVAFGGVAKAPYTLPTDQDFLNNVIDTIKNKGVGDALSAATAQAQQIIDAASLQSATDAKAALDAAVANGNSQADAIIKAAKDTALSISNTAGASAAASTATGQTASASTPQASTSNSATIQPADVAAAATAVASATQAASSFVGGLKSAGLFQFRSMDAGMQQQQQQEKNSYLGEEDYFAPAVHPAAAAASSSVAPALAPLDDDKLFVDKMFADAAAYAYPGLSLLGPRAASPASKSQQPVLVPVPAYASPATMGTGAAAKSEHLMASLADALGGFETETGKGTSSSSSSSPALSSSGISPPQLQDAAASGTGAAAKDGTSVSSGSPAFVPPHRQAVRFSDLDMASESAASAAASIGALTEAEMDSASTVHSLADAEQRISRIVERNGHAARGQASQAVRALWEEKLAALHAAVAMKDSEAAIAESDALLSRAQRSLKDAPGRALPLSSSFWPQLKARLEHPPPLHFDSVKGTYTLGLSTSALMRGGGLAHANNAPSHDASLGDASGVIFLELPGAVAAASSSPSDSHEPARRAPPPSSSTSINNRVRGAPVGSALLRFRSLEKSGGGGSSSRSASSDAASGRKSTSTSVLDSKDVDASVDASTVESSAPVVVPVAPSPAPSNSATRSITPSTTPTSAATPSSTSTPTGTSSKTGTPSSTASSTRTPSTTASASPTPSRTATTSPTGTPSATPSASYQPLSSRRGYGVGMVCSGRGQCIPNWFTLLDAMQQTETAVAAAAEKALGRPLASTTDSIVALRKALSDSATSYPHLPSSDGNPHWPFDPLIEAAILDRLHLTLTLSTATQASLGDGGGGKFLAQGTSPLMMALEALNVGGMCRCEPGFRGAACEERYVAADHGTCNQKSGACRCQAVTDAQVPAFPGQLWTGPTCELRTCPAGSCGANGQCNHETGTCSCYPGWGGPTCSRSLCPNECNYNGRCQLVRTGGSNATAPPVAVSGLSALDPMAAYAAQCLCDSGWGDADCSRKACVNDCNGNGHCSEDGTCFCMNGWIGSDCSVSTQAGAGAYIVNTTDTVQAACGGCNGLNGFCKADSATCYCNAPWTGKHCLEMGCPNGCSSHGVCSPSNGTCTCAAFWGGSDCNSPDSSNAGEASTTSSKSGSGHKS